MSANDLDRLELQIGRLFRAGIAISAATLALGLVLFVAHSPRATAVLEAGLILLMAIPILRVVISFADSVRRRDGLLTAATATVIVVVIWLFFHSSR